MAKIPYATATLPQLIAFATMTQGLDVAHNIKEPALRAKLAEAGFSGDEIEIEDDLARTPRAPLTVAEVASRKLIRIKIPHQEGVAGGNQDVPVGVNGRVALIQRGIEVDAPAEYVEVLSNAEKMIYDRGPNGELTNPRLVPIYPFSILGVVA